MPDPEQSPPPKGEFSAGPAAHWSKDFVEHLRTVHFSLVAGCLALIVLASSRDPKEIGRAREEMEQIVQVVKLWDRGWLISAAKYRLDQAEKEGRDWLSWRQFATPGLQGKGNGVSFRYEGKTQSLRIDPPNWLIYGKIQDLSEAVHDDPDTLVPEITLAKPKTLAEFREMWDALDEPTKILVPLALDNQFYSQTRGVVQEAGSFTYTTILDKQSRDHLTLSRYANPKSANRNGPSYVVRLDRLLSFPVVGYEEIEFVPQQALANQFPGKEKPRLGSFSRSFRALDNVTANYQTSEIEQFDAVLASEQKRTGESFQLFGINFPAEGTTLWGIIVVLGIQLYFWTHLHDLTAKLQPTDPGWEVAWIGVYRSTASRILFHFSAFVLPIVTVIMLGVRGLRFSSFGHWYLVLLLTGTASSLALSFLSWKRAPHPQTKS
jgi:hypothetical protein